MVGVDVGVAVGVGVGVGRSKRKTHFFCTSVLVVLCNVTLRVIVSTSRSSKSQDTISAAELIGCVTQSGVKGVHSVGSEPSPQCSLNCLKLAVASMPPAITKGFSRMLPPSCISTRSIIGLGASRRHSRSGLITSGSGKPYRSAQALPASVFNH